MSKQAINVVSFPEKAPSANDKPARTKRADTALIRECVIYAQSIGAFEAGFEADPSGNSEYAGPLGRHHDGRANQALAKISRMRATTAEGLQAKARIAPFFDTECMWVKREQDFVLSFAADVKAFLEPIIHEHRSAAHLAKQGKVQS